MPTKPEIKTKYSPQEIFNQSFDEDFRLIVVEGVGFDGQNLVKNKSDDLALQMDYDSSSNPIYIGQAATGTSTSSALWQIRKLTFDASGNLTVIRYANGSANFDQVWNNRVSLTYA